MLGEMKPFIELALRKGVKRLVLITSSQTSTSRGNPEMGRVQKYVTELGVEYCILRPTWFMDNFGHWGHFVKGIRDEGVIKSATGGGKMPLISIGDIVDVAFNALVDENSHDTNHILVGPELLTYDEAAEIFSKVLGRKIAHQRLTDQECLDIQQVQGTHSLLAELLLELEKLVAAGCEEPFFHAQKKIEEGISDYELRCDVHEVYARDD
ncbi:hypothetical protein FPV67DRAFT_379479 [Lyophyllum atratum]|nr:hypothetical protein FPV67DRAFT_379479 [Lyophyllum atratum]